ncbi:MAG: hypothetical protein H6822_19205 [Planctomycetaceae bacterium]|nr:hypothetical protein [Planctomycetaceae bacterium]
MFWRTKKPKAFQTEVWRRVDSVYSGRVVLEVWRDETRPEGALRRVTINRWQKNFFSTETRPDLLEADLEDVIKAVKTAKRRRTPLRLL